MGEYHVVLYINYIYLYGALARYAQALARLEQAFAR